MSKWIEYNANPRKKKVGDCAIRACAVAAGITWDEAFDQIVKIARREKDVLSANRVWGMFLEDYGYIQEEIEEKCTVRDFCYMHPKGQYVLGLDGHVVTVINGEYYDTWDSGYKSVLNYWHR